MKIEQLKIKNFKACKEIKMSNIPNFCVVIGANGSGKSTLFSVFGFLQEAFSSNVHAALAKQGGGRGFSEVRSRGSDGNIEIELKFRTEDMGRKTQHQPLMTYHLAIGKNDNNRAVVEREVLKYRRGRRGQPWEFLNFSRGQGMAVTNELAAVEDEKDLTREKRTLKSPDILAIKGLSQFEKFPAVVALGQWLEHWHVSDIHVSQARNEQQAGLAEHLSTEGENLSLVIDYLRQSHPSVLEKIMAALKERIPGISEVQSQTIETGQTLLTIKYNDFNEPFLARYVSDGSIKMLAYLVLLYDPEPHPLLCVEAPENQLYPNLLEELAEEFRSYAHRGGQVFVSTHSPDFLNAMQLDEVFFLIKKEGYTIIKRAAEDDQIKQYMEDGDKMGRLWRQGFFAGVANA